MYLFSWDEQSFSLQFKTLENFLLLFIPFFGLLLSSPLIISSLEKPNFGLSFLLCPICLFCLAFPLAFLVDILLPFFAVLKPTVEYEINTSNNVATPMSTRFQNFFLLTDFPVTQQWIYRFYCIEPIRFHNLSVLWFQVGFQENGTITYMDTKLYQNNGHVINESALPTTVHHFQNCYDNSTWKLTAYSVMTDVPVNTYCRAPGS